MPATVLVTAPGTPVDLNLAVTTPHVLAYRCWTRPGSEAKWTLLAQGHTPPDGTFHTTFTPGAGSQFYYWMGVGNFHGGSVYAVTLTFSQGGQHLQGGTIPWTGKTDTAGNDVTQDVVFFP
jgi:hypothetical protein